jgi:hypothetical protein
LLWVFLAGGGPATPRPSPAPPPPPPGKTPPRPTKHKHTGPDATQEEIFQHCEPLVDGVLAGINGTIMGELGGSAWASKRGGGEPRCQKTEPALTTPLRPSPTHQKSPKPTTKTTAYGQSGSGKTHTLIGAVGGQQDGGGDDDDSDGPGAGVVPRACRLLLERLQKQQEQQELKEQQGVGTTTASSSAPAVAMTAVEIYAERVRCLLGGGANLPLKQDAGASAGGSGGGGVRADGAAEVQVRADAEGLRLLLAALSRTVAQRAVAATDMNEASSRSHCVVTLRLLLPPGGAASGAAAAGGAKLCLVDLAGSERAGRTGAAGQALAEGSAINKSLSALAGVVSALAAGGGGAGGGGGEGEQQQQQQQSQQGQQQQHQPAPPHHVPYRDSKLTLLLRDALGGGRSRTVLVVCCSTARRDAAETLSSLRFASRARGIKCMVAGPTPAAGGGLAAAAAAELRAEVAALRARLAASSCGGPSPSQPPVTGKPLLLLLPWLLRCASAVVMGAYLAWEAGGGQGVAGVGGGW